jgi:hypothetical protein
MSWFPFDDKAHSDDRFRRAGLAGVGLYAMAGAYCADQLTDGFVPDWFVRQFANGSRTVRILIAEGLLTRRAGEGGVNGYQFVDFPESLTRAASEERKRRWRDDKRKRKSGNDFSVVVSTKESATESSADSSVEPRLESASETTRFPPIQSPESKFQEGGLGRPGTALATANPILNIPPRNPAEDDSPQPWCSRHPGGTDAPCGACGRANDTYKRAKAERESAQIARQQREAENCKRCEEGWLLGPDRKPVEPARRCDHRPPTHLEGFNSPSPTPAQSVNRPRQ